MHHLVDASSQIEIGATEVDVVAILGAPTEQYEQRGGWAQLLMGARLERPTIAILKGSEKWLEPVYFFSKILEFLSRKHHELNRCRL